MEPDKLTWYFDGKQVAQENTPADMNKPMYLVLSTVVGSASSWTGAPTPGETGQMQVDYVRAYSRGASAAAAPAASTASASSSAATGTSTLKLSLSEDAYQGDAQFSVAIDGKTIGSPQTVTALHSSGGAQDFSFSQALTAGTHDVAVSFINDAYGGSGATDRNLYINGASVDSHRGQRGSSGAVRQLGAAHLRQRAGACLTACKHYR